MPNGIIAYVFLFFNMHKILDGCKDVEEAKEKIKVLTGDELKEFEKNQVTNCYLVENIDLVDARISHLHLWTEKGALTSCQVPEYR